MAKSTSLVKYADYSVEDAEHDEQEREQGGGGVFVKIKVGKTKLRVVPFLEEVAQRPGYKKWRRVTHIHYVRIPGQEDSVQVICPRLEATAKRACIVCDAEKRLWAEVDLLEKKGKLGAAEASRKKAKGLKCKRRCFMVVINRDTPENGPMIYGFGTMVEDQLIEMRKDIEEGGNFVTPTSKGYDIRIVRKGTGKMDTEYDVKRALNPSPLTDDVKQLEEWLKAAPDVDRYCRVYSDEDIKKVLRGEKPGGDEDEDEKPSKKKTSSKRKSVEDDIEDAEYEENDDEDEEEDDEDDDEEITVNLDD